jgi:hypothetical protein
MVSDLHFLDVTCKHQHLRYAVIQRAGHKLSFLKTVEPGVADVRPRSHTCIGLTHTDIKRHKGGFHLSLYASFLLLPEKSLLCQLKGIRKCKACRIRLIHFCRCPDGQLRSIVSQAMATQTVCHQKKAGRSV